MVNRKYNQNMNIYTPADETTLPLENIEELSFPKIELLESRPIEEISLGDLSL